MSHLASNISTACFCQTVDNLHFVGLLEKSFHNPVRDTCNRFSLIWGRGIYFEKGFMFLPVALTGIL